MTRRVGSESVKGGRHYREQEVVSAAVVLSLRKQQWGVWGRGLGVAVFATLAGTGREKGKMAAETELMGRWTSAEQHLQNRVVK